ncbi:MAG: hypothetical protein LBL86_03595 [Coriobacteriales bacterium]|jgi:hypothetical protein|nr:hypothetical protein [Coriobacteriales bacterium]
MLRLSNESGTCPPKIFALLLACLLFISSLTIATPPAAYAVEENALLEWGQYFERTYEKVDAYHFALLRRNVRENGEIVGQVVPHLEGTIVTYAIEDTSGWSDPDALNSTVNRPGSRGEFCFPLHETLRLLRRSAPSLYHFSSIYDGAL